MSALDLILATESDLETGRLARAELAALRATVAEQARQLHEAYLLLTAINFVAQNNDIEKWLAANASVVQEQT